MLKRYAAGVIATIAVSSILSVSAAADENRLEEYPQAIFDYMFSATTPVNFIRVSEDVLTNSLKAFVCIGDENKSENYVSEFVMQDFFVSKPAEVIIQPVEIKADVAVNAKERVQDCKNKLKTLRKYNFRAGLVVAPNLPSGKSISEFENTFLEDNSAAEFKTETMGVSHCTLRRYVRNKRTFASLGFYHGDGGSASAFKCMLSLYAYMFGINGTLENAFSDRSDVYRKYETMTGYLLVYLYSKFGSLRQIRTDTPPDEFRQKLLEAQNARN